VLHPDAHVEFSDAELWRRAVHCYAIRDWWMVHELLEELWRRHPDSEDARACQGLLQAAVCLHHYGNGNFAGARPLARQALELLAGFETTPKQWPPVFNLTKFQANFREATAPLLNAHATLKPLSPTNIPNL